MDFLTMVQSPEAQKEKIFISTSAHKKMNNEKLQKYLKLRSQMRSNLPSILRCLRN